MGACRGVCSYAVRSSFLQPVSFRGPVPRHYQNSSRAAVRKKKNESHVSEDEEAKAKQHAQHQAKQSAKHGACRDEDGRRRLTDRLDQPPCMKRIYPPAPVVSPTSSIVPLPDEVQEPTVPGPSSPLASLPSTFGSTLLLSCSSKNARSSLIFIIARSRRTLLILASSFAASTSFRRRLSWMHFL